MTSRYATGHGTSALKPAAAKFETWPRPNPMGNLGVLVSQRLHLVGIDLPANELITSITFVCHTTAMVGGVNQWFGLFDSAGVPLRLTVDDGATAWASPNAKTLALSSTFTTTYAGLHYLGILVNAATVPSLTGLTVAGTLSSLAPQINGAANTGLTNPASCPNPVTIGGSGATVFPYAYVS